MSRVMEREIITFENEADWLDMRLRDITSTDCAALFGQSPYKTIFSVYHTKKRALMNKFKENEYIKWGQRLERIIANGLAEEHGFKIEPMDEYIRIPELRIGSSFDFRIGKDTVFEIKNVSDRVFRSQWVFDKETALAPPHIELQVQHQLALSGYSSAYIGVLAGGNTSYLLRRDRNEEVIEEIFKRTAEFWRAFDAGEEPEPDLFGDHKSISELYSYAEPGTTGLSDDHLDSLVRRYREVSKQISGLDAEKKRLKSEMLMKIGSTERIDGGLFTISAATMPEAEVSYTRKPYRNFRINYRKEYDSLEDV